MVMTEEVVDHWRTGQNTQHTVTVLLRHLVFVRLARYEDTNDAERLCVCLVMRHVIGGLAMRLLRQGASRRWLRAGSIWDISGRERTERQGEQALTDTHDIWYNIY